MPTELACYVHFDGNCREAIDYYVAHLGATVEMLSTYGEVPGGEGAPQGEKDWIIYARLLIDGQPIMMSDAPAQFQERRQGFNISLTVETPEEADRLYAALLDGGFARMEMQETFFAHRFAMLNDRFGTPWMISCNKPMA